MESKDIKDNNSEEEKYKNLVKLKEKFTSTEIETILQNRQTILENTPIDRNSIRDRTYWQTLPIFVTKHKELNGQIIVARRPHLTVYLPELNIKN